MDIWHGAKGCSSVWFSIILGEFNLPPKVFDEIFVVHLLKMHFLGNTTENEKKIAITSEPLMLDAKFFF